MRIAEVVGARRAQVKLTPVIYANNIDAFKLNWIISFVTF